MNYKKILLILLFFLILPKNVFAISNKYQDVVYEITNYEKIDGHITLYLFHGEECPHCQEEKEWIQTIKNKYKNVDFVYYEVWHNQKNSMLLKEVFQKFSIQRNSVPLTIIGEKYYIGFSDTLKKEMENTIREYLEINEEKEMYLPIIKNINPQNVSITLVAIILGVIDGFNPCAMWILLFLINMLLNINNKKKRLVLGSIFLITSSLVYFLSMLGVSFILNYTTITWIRYGVALLAIILGITNLIKYIKNIKQKDIGCEVIDDHKRNKIIKKLQKISQEKSFLLATIGIIILAISVNLIELACSLGFPLIFTEILALNQIEGIKKIIYLLIYIFFYMLDDMIVFIIAMKTLEITGISNKYNKYVKLIGGILMIIIGILMIFKYQWLTLNF